MRQYYLQSVLIHFSVFLMFMLFQFLRPTQDIIWLAGPGFDLGGGGGGDGIEGDGKPAPKGVKDQHRGQVVPQPTEEVLPEKPAPVAKETRAEETIAVKDPEKKLQPAKKKKETTSKVAPVGDKEQKAQSNKIRRGTKVGEKAGSEFGLVDGEGTGSGRGIGIGLGPGSGGGFGFGGYANVIYRRILEEWLQYTPIGVDKSCVIGLTISKRGQVSGIKLEKSSGDPMFDNIAKRAVRNASPLPPLPVDFPKPSQRFRLKFRLLE